MQKVAKIFNWVLTYNVRYVIIMLPIEKTAIDTSLYGLAFGCFEEKNIVRGPAEQ